MVIKVGQRRAALSPHSILIDPSNGGLAIRISDDHEAIEIGFGDDVAIFTGAEMMEMLRSALIALRARRKAA